MARWLLMACGLWGCLAMPGCTPWRVGQQSLYRCDIRTVYVPMFESDILRKQIPEWLTEAVAKEIELHTPYKVVPSPAADSVLTGRVTAEHKRVLAEDPNNLPRLVTTEFTVQVSWFDRQGQVLMQSSFTSASDFVAEGGQSLTASQQQMVSQLARQIVAQMETPNW